MSLPYPSMDNDEKWQNAHALFFFLVISSIHSLGAVGHIEDIAVAKDQQGKKLGLRIIQALDFIADKVGCYKSILDCSEANEGFYVKCGFRRAGLQMAHYYQDGSKGKSQ